MSVYRTIGPLVCGQKGSKSSRGDRSKYLQFCRRYIRTYLCFTPEGERRDSHGESDHFEQLWPISRPIGKCVVYKIFGVGHQNSIKYNLSRVMRKPDFCIC